MDIFLADVLDRENIGLLHLNRSSHNLEGDFCSFESPLAPSRALDLFDFLSVEDELAGNPRLVFYISSHSSYSFIRDIKELEKVCVLLGFPCLLVI